MTSKLDSLKSKLTSHKPAPIDLDQPFLGVPVDLTAGMHKDGEKSAIPSSALYNPDNYREPLPNNIYSTATALKLAAILSEYDKQVIQDAVQLRTYITNKLLYISDSGNTRDELRALELLGKISDVGLFVEKSEIKITHTASTELESALRGKIEKILQAKQFSAEKEEIEEGVLIDLQSDDSVIDTPSDDE